MRSVWVCLLFLSAVCSVTCAADNPIAGIDPLLYVTEGWQWGAPQDEASYTASNTGIVLNIQPVNGGTTNGMVGVSFGTGAFGSMAYDYELYNLEMKFRVLGENEAGALRVILNEPDLNPDPAVSTVDEFGFVFGGLLGYEENEWITVTQPLSSPTYIWSGDPVTGDQMQDDGLASIQIGAEWNNALPLNVEIASVLIKPINPTSDNVAFEFNANNARRAWTWGAFSTENHPGAVVNDGKTIKIDLNETDASQNNTTFGGLGMHWLQHDFDAETAELVVEAKLGENNTAPRFSVVLKDDDGLDGIVDWGSWDPFEQRELDQLAEEFQYQFSTEDLSEEEFTELRLPFYDEDGFATHSYRGEPAEAWAIGDGEQNFGNYMVQIQSLWGSSERLNIEVKSIRIETPFTDPADLNGDGTRTAADIDALTVATINKDPDPKYDLDDSGTLDEADRTVLVEDLFYTYFGDANLDGEFTSNDFVDVFIAGQYEDAVAGNSGWATGDWNGDLEFDSSDFVTAFVAGGYELGARQAVSAVPEPSSMVLLALALLGLVSRRRTR